MHNQSRIEQTLTELANLQRVQSMLAEHPAHRTALADRVCTEFGFIDSRGHAQRAGCLKALRSFEQAGHVVLPAPRRAAHAAGATTHAPIDPAGGSGRRRAGAGQNIMSRRLPILSWYWSRITSSARCGTD